MDISVEQFLVRHSRCIQCKHKFRENRFGVVWCTNCGLLGKNCADKVTSEDCLLVKL